MEIGKWKEVVLAGGFSEEWGYVCPECGCIVSDKSRLGFRYMAENQKMNYCPNCGTRLYGEPDKELPSLAAFKFFLDSAKKLIFCSIRMKWHGEDVAVTVTKDLEELYSEPYLRMEETE